MKRLILILATLPLLLISCEKEHEPNNNEFIKDAVFKKYLLNNFDLNNDGKLSAEEIILVKSIEVNDLGIKSLDGIDRFVNLVHLYCSNNQLEMLDVSGCVNLETLICSNNKLAALNVSECKYLKYLYCDFNQLDALDVSKSYNLKQLICNDNLLKSLDTSNCLKLLSLKCESNQLELLNIDKLFELVELICNDNLLAGLDVSECTNLRSLYCYSNPNLLEVWAYPNQFVSYWVFPIVSLEPQTVSTIHKDEHTEVKTIETAGI